MQCKGPGADVGLVVRGDQGGLGLELGGQGRGPGKSDGTSQPPRPLLLDKQGLMCGSRREQGHRIPQLQRGCGSPPSCLVYVCALRPTPRICPPGMQGM